MSLVSSQCAVHCALFHGFRAGGAEKFPASLVIDREIIFAFELIRKSNSSLGLLLQISLLYFFHICYFDTVWLVNVKYY